MSQSSEEAGGSVTHGVNRYEWDGELNEFTKVRVSKAVDTDRADVQEIPLHRLVSQTNGEILEAFDARPRRRPRH